MRIICEGKAIGCVVPNGVQAALRARAASESMTPSQMAAELIQRGLESGMTVITAVDDALAEARANEKRLQAMLDARAGQVRQLEGAVSELRVNLKIATDALGCEESEVLKLRDDLIRVKSECDAALEELNELRPFPALVEQLRERLAAMEAAPIKKSENSKLTEMLDEERARLASAYRSAGWKPGEIAHELGMSIIAVTALFNGKRP